MTRHPINDPAKLKEDVRKIGGYVKENLFYRVINIYVEDAFDDCGFFHEDYKKNCRELIVGSRASETFNETDQAYMTHLWTVMKEKKMYKQWLAEKRSNAYQSVMDKFHRELLFAR